MRGFKTVESVTTPHLDSTPLPNCEGFLAMTQAAGADATPPIGKTHSFQK